MCSTSYRLGTSCSGHSRTYVNLNLDHFYRVSGVNLNTNYWSLQNANSVTEELSPSESALTEANCNATADYLHIANGQSCQLLAQEYTYEYITIESGGEITLEGDSSGADKTELVVERLHIRPGGSLVGVGTGACLIEHLLRHNYQNNSDETTLFVIMFTCICLLQKHTVTA